MRVAGSIILAAGAAFHPEPICTGMGRCEVAPFYSGTRRRKLGRARSLLWVQKRTSADATAKSAEPSTADIAIVSGKVRYVAQSDSCTAANHFYLIACRR